MKKRNLFILLFVLVTAVVPYGSPAQRKARQVCVDTELLMLSDDYWSPKNAKTRDRDMKTILEMGPKGNPFSKRLSTVFALLMNELFMRGFNDTSRINEISAKNTSIRNELLDRQQKKNPQQEKIESTINVLQSRIKNLTNYYEIKQTILQKPVFFNYKPQEDTIKNFIEFIQNKLSSQNSINIYKLKYLTAFIKLESAIRTSYHNTKIADIESYYLQIHTNKKILKQAIANVRERKKRESCTIL